MADINLKTLTPDTSLPTDGFLFGADSQASASPSVYSTQTVATTLLGSTALSGATVTTSQPVLNLSQTWNAGAVTFTGLKFNATDTASAAGSLLLDLQVGGTSVFNITKGGTLVLPNNSISGSTYYRINTSGIGFYRVGTYFGMGSSPVSPDAFITSPTTATWQLGAADAAAPVAQTLQVQSVVAGTSNTAGANWTLKGSAGTGTGAGGSIIFQVAPAGSSGTAQNAYSTALTIASNRAATFAFTVNGATFDVGTTTSTNSSGLALASGASVGWSQDGTYYGTQDVLLRRDAANTLALRNGAAAQTFRVYNTFDGTVGGNNEYGVMRWSGNVLCIGSEVSGTGTARVVSVGSNPTGSPTANLALSGNNILFYTTAGQPWQMTAAGHFMAATDNTYDIGASGATRPRNVYVGTQIFASAGTIGTIKCDFINNSSNSRTFWTFASSADSAQFAQGLTTPLMQFSGTTSSFPALKRSTTTLQVRLADDSAYTALEASTVRTATAYTVATLPAAGTAGRRAYVTDATAPTFLGALTGGGAVVTPVFDNGTAWVAG